MRIVLSFIENNLVIKPLSPRFGEPPKSSIQNVQKNDKLVIT